MTGKGFALISPNVNKVSVVVLLDASVQSMPLKRVQNIAYILCLSNKFSHDIVVKKGIFTKTSALNTQISQCSKQVPVHNSLGANVYLYLTITDTRSL